MNSMYRRCLAAAAVAVACATSALAADPFPSKPLRIIVSSAPGGQLDITARVVAKAMGDKLGQSVIVENRVGAGGLVAIRAMQATPADGYTLLATVNTVAIQQAVSKDPGYDLVKDLTGIGPMTRSPFIVVAPPSQPDKSLAELIGRAKTNPGQITYGSAGQGSTTHFAAALFAQKAGVNLLHVPYKGNSAVWPDLMSGRVGLLFEGYGSGISMVKDGRLKILAVTSNKRMELLPDIPTVAESGAPGYSFYLWVGLLAPAATPKDVVQKLNAALRAVLVLPEVASRFRDEGAEASLMSPEEFNQFLKDEVGTMSKAVAELALPKE